MDLVAQLHRLGYEAAQQDHFAVFAWEVECGPLAGDTVRVALNGQSWPDAPPGGPVVSPQLMPEGRPGEHPYGGVHPASTGGFNDPDNQWQYWSRPFQGWRATYTASDYMSHIRHLFDTLPDDFQLGADN